MKFDDAECARSGYDGKDMTMKLTDDEIKNWAGGRPTNPTTEQGVRMALELRDLRILVEERERQLVNVNASLAHALRERNRLEENRDITSLRSWLASWGNGPNWFDPTGATVPIAKTTLAELLDRVARLEQRWIAAEPFVNAGIDLYNEALQDSFPSGVVPAYDRRTVTAALAPAMNGLIALHETMSDDEIDEYLTAAGVDPDKLAERGRARILELLRKRREARR